MVVLWVLWYDPLRCGVPGRRRTEGTSPALRPSVGATSPRSGVLNRARPVPNEVMEAKLKHLEFIQGIVNRLATDSFGKQRTAR